MNLLYIRVWKNCNLNDMNDITYFRVMTKVFVMIRISLGPMNKEKLCQNVWHIGECDPNRCEKNNNIVGGGPRMSDDNLKYKC